MKPALNEAIKKHVVNIRGKNGWQWENGLEWRTDGHIVLFRAPAAPLCSKCGKRPRDGERILCPTCDEKSRKRCTVCLKHARLDGKVICAICEELRAKKGPGASWVKIGVEARKKGIRIPRPKKTAIPTFTGSGPIEFRPGAKWELRLMGELMKETQSWNGNGYRVQCHEVRSILKSLKKGICDGDNCPAIKVTFLKSGAMSFAVEWAGNEGEISTKELGFAEPIATKEKYAQGYLSLIAKGSGKTDYVEFYPRGPEPLGFRIVHQDGDTMIGFLANCSPED